MSMYSKSFDISAIYSNLRSNNQLYIAFRIVLFLECVVLLLANMTWERKQKCMCKKLFVFFANATNNKEES